MKQEDADTLAGWVNEIDDDALYKLILWLWKLWILRMATRYGHTK